MVKNDEEYTFYKINMWLHFIEMKNMALGNKHLNKQIHAYDVRGTYIWFWLLDKYKEKRINYKKYVGNAFL